MPHHDPLPLLQVADRNAKRSLALDGDGAVHLGKLDRNPAPLEPNPGFQVSCRIEVFRSDRFGGGRLDGYFFDLKRHRAKATRFADRPFQILLAGRDDLNARVARILLLPTDLDALDVEFDPQIH